MRIQPSMGFRKQYRSLLAICKIFGYVGKTAPASVRRVPIVPDLTSIAHTVKGLLGSGVSFALWGQENDAEPSTDSDYTMTFHRQRRRTK